MDSSNLDTWLDRCSSIRIQTIDTHTAGEPLRIILGGVPLPGGDTILERRRNAKRDWDRYRRILMFEPRGHADMYGALIVPPVSPDALFGVLYMHNEGYSTGCGHATIALARVAVELGWVTAEEPITRVNIDAPSGLLKAYARVEYGASGRMYGASGHIYGASGQRVAGASRPADSETQREVAATRPAVVPETATVVASGFENVPSFAPILEETVSVPGYGDVRFDLGYGGAFYAYVEAESLNLDLTMENGRRIVDAGMAIKRAVADRFPIDHPESADLSYLYGTIFTGRAEQAENHSRHVCIFADGALDRSPTGTGVAGRVAILNAKGKLPVDQGLRFESITGESFQGRVLRTTTVGNIPAVIPEIEGTAYITGRHEFVLEPDDPLADGFIIR